MTVEGSVKDTPKGFAELMNSFNKLTEIESRIDAAISNSKVPCMETRKFLKGMKLNQVLNTPLSQFIRDLFKEIGLGDLELSQKSNFKYVYTIKDSPISSLFRDIQDKKVCEPTVNAIHRFFAEDLGLDGEVEETKCVNVGNDFCEFQMDLQPFHVFEIALDQTDLDILNEILHLESGQVEIDKLGESLQIDNDELSTRLTLLQYYEVLDDKYEISQVGHTFYKFRLKNPFCSEKEFEPPWKSMAELTSTIAATQSFAEALVVITEEEKLPWEEDESELVDIKKEAKDKTSFAEFLSAEMKKEDDEEKEDEDKDDEEKVDEN